MAELAKKLYFKKNGVEQTAKAYSTTAEAGNEYIPNKIDGVDCYVAIGDTTDSRATIGRVKKSSTAAERAILSTGKPPYNAVWFTQAGTFTFTVPAGVFNVLITGCGGGAGGLTVANYDWNAPQLSATGNSGGNSSFGSFSIQGGKGAKCSGLRIEEKWNGEFTDRWVGGSHSQGEVALPNGRVGGFIIALNRDFDIGGAAGFALAFDGSNGNYGQGGNTHHYFDSDGLAAQVGAGGNSGAYVSRQNVEVTPNSTVTVIVGAGGAAVVNQNDGEAWRYTATDGTNGFICIEYGGDI
jgi:hypothetical protein